MAEAPPKRQREEIPDDSSSELEGSSANSKRQKPYNNILNILDEEEEPEPSHEPSPELSQDLSAIFTTFQQELSSSTSCGDDSITTTTTTTFDFESLPSTAAVDEAHYLTASASAGDEDESVKSVMRHLLEASDDELGIPNTINRDENNVGEGLDNSAENLPFDFNENGLWEFEDEAANYYTVLQSELFM